MLLKKTNSPVISVVGAGGKTSFIYKTASWFVSKGEKVIITTTTHMQKQNKWKNSYSGSSEEIRKLLKTEQIIVAGIPCGNGKIKGLERKTLEEITAWNIPVLIEADGAKHMPCKAPREHEPVIIPQTNVVVAVAGLDAVHKPIKQVCYCSKEVAAILNCSEEKVLTCEDIVTLMADSDGMRKGVTENMDYWVVLNKADSPEQVADAREIERQLNRIGIKQVKICSLLNDMFYDSK